MGQRATSQGAPPQVPSPGLCSPRQMPGTTWPHGLQAARCPGHQRKAFPRPNHPAPLSPKAQRRRQAPAPRRRRCHSPGGLSPEEQARAEVRVVQRVGLPHLAGGGRPRAGVALSSDGAAPGGAGRGKAGGSDTAQSSLRETEPPASRSGA